MRTKRVALRSSKVTSRERIALLSAASASEGLVLMEGATEANEGATEATEPSFSIDIESLEVSSVKSKVSIQGLVVKVVSVERAIDRAFLLGKSALVTLVELASVRG